MGEMRLRCVVKRSTNAPGYTTNTNMPKPFTLTCSLPGAEKHDKRSKTSEKEILKTYFPSERLTVGVLNEHIVFGLYFTTE